MGSKGSSPQTTQSQQQYTPNPYIAGGGQQAISGAEYAASQPFQLPVAPLAPFDPFQNQAFSGVQQAVGMAQPYFGMGAGYLQGSAAPITGDDVANYYNPMASNVMAGMQDIFGQQMRETTGQATQAAGGVGADRIGVAQANLARQQALAGGQTLAGLYYPALQAAQQQKQMMAGAGYGLGQMGPAAQGAQLQSLQAMLGAGGMQQQLAQQYLNNLYQNRLAQIGYQFQTPQYLAGITGGLAPAMGGTTSGLQQTWAPQPSPLAQALGIGTSLFGLGMAPFTGGSSLGLTGLGGSMKGGMGGMGAYPTVLGGSFRSGGRVPTHMKGGGAPTTLPKAPDPIYSPKAMTTVADPLPPGGISTEDALAQADPYFQWYGGVPAVNRAQIAAMTTPAALRAGAPSMPMESRTASIAAPMGASELSKPPDMFQSWMQRMQQKEPDLIDPDPFGLKAAASLGSAQGGAVDPMSAGEGFQVGGLTPPPVGTTPPSAQGLSGQALQTAESAIGRTPLIGNLRAAGINPAQLSPLLGDVAQAQQTQASPAAPMAAPPMPPTTGQPTNPQAILSSLQQRFPQFAAQFSQFPGGSQKGSGAARGGRIGYQEGGDIDPGFQYDTAGAMPRDPHFTMGDLVDRASDFYFPPQSEDSPANVKKLAQQIGIPQPFAEKKAAPATPAPMTSDVGDIPYETPSASPEDTTTPMPRSRPAFAGPTGEGNFTRQRPPQTPTEMQDQARFAANKYGIPENIAMRLFTRENNWSTRRGAAGEYGPGQIMPETARTLGIDPTNNYENIDGAMKYLRQQYDEFGNWHDATAAYNAGPGAVRSGRIPASALAYANYVGQDAPVGEGAESAQFAAYHAPAPMGAGVSQQMGQAPMPYPDALQRDWGQRLTRSPWMSLVKAGAAMATTVGPIGSVIGQGIKAGAGELEGQRKELRDEESINQKAQALYQQAQIHLDRYQKMTPYQQEEVRLREEALAQGKYREGNMEIIDDKGQPKTIAVRFNPKIGQYEDPQTGLPVFGKLIARQTGAESATSKANIAFRAAKDDPDYMTDQLSTINKWRRQQGLEPLPAGSRVPTQADLDFIKANPSPENVARFKNTFGIDPP